jgi:hypothetical protein
MFTFTCIISEAEDGDMYVHYHEVSGQHDTEQEVIESFVRWYTFTTFCSETKTAIPFDVNGDIHEQFQYDMRKNGLVGTLTISKS